jgi:hypothetical protein
MCQIKECNSTCLEYNYCKYGSGGQMKKSTIRGLSFLISFPFLLILVGFREIFYYADILTNDNKYTDYIQYLNKSWAGKYTEFLFTYQRNENEDTDPFTINFNIWLIFAIVIWGWIIL